MSACKNTVEQIVPTRYSSKIVVTKCGSTSIYGTPLFCDECAKFEEVLPVTSYEDAGEDDFNPNWRFEPTD